MGGFGSGRWRHGKKTTNGYLRLDVRKLHRDGLMIPGETSNLRWSRNGKEIASIKGKMESDRMVLTYNHKQRAGDWQPMEYTVRIEWTSCNYGGQRPWFICPVKKCNRRVAILYGDRIFACRKCHELVYRSQRETADNRALSRAQNIRMRLGGSENMLKSFPSKPKGMHWMTHLRLTDQYYAFSRISLLAMAKLIGMKIEI